MFVSFNNKNTITAISDHYFKIYNENTVKLKNDRRNWGELVGKKIHDGVIVMTTPPKPFAELRVAVICNWNDKCGISTYSKFLVNALIPKVKELHVFSEVSNSPTSADESFVTRCWKRGDSLRPAIKQILNWQPDFIIVQHEYGIFPNACHFFKMMEMIDDIPYAVVMHSVYNHLDKAVYCSVIKNIITHNPNGVECLKAKGHTGNVFVVPHGCLKFDNNDELWNIMQNPYTILQFGFGFQYKGVDRAIEAVSILKQKDKFKNLFYCFLLSTNSHNQRAHDEYYYSLIEKCKTLGVEDNVAIIRKYNSDEMLNLYLRVFKLAVFPYTTTENNTVYAASGAIRIAIANKIPVVCSDSHLFDDMDGIVPRPNSSETLAKEIDKIFSDSNYRNAIVQNGVEYINKNTWDVSADRYLDVYNQIMSTRVG